MTTTTQPRRAARHLQARTGQPYQRLLTLAEAACSDRDDDETIARRRALFTFALAAAVPDAGSPAEALLALVWPDVDLAAVDPAHLDTALTVADTVVAAAAVSGVGRTVRDGLVFHDAAPASPAVGDLVTAATAIELIDARSVDDTLAAILEQWQADAPADTSLVELADSWWHVFTMLACDRLFTAAGLHPPMWPTDRDGTTERD